MKSIFVSSTFRDMNFERDILNKSIAPKLNYYLSEHNQALRLLDLRWGVDTSDMNEQEASERVLRVCFDQLENCKPYIIILLGDRYGYIPENSDVSITHMEILKGVIENAEKDHVFIYMRNADYSGMPDELKQVYIEQNAAAKNKLESLKNQLKNLVPERCFQYNSHWENGQLVSEEFEQSVLDNLKKEFVEGYASTSFKSPLQKQFLENEEILKDNLKYAYQNEGVISTVVDDIKNGDMPYGIIGEGGTGKSIFLSLLCSALRADGQNVNILFCGDNQFSSYVRNAAEYVLYSLITAAGLQYDFEKYAKLDYNELLGEAMKLKDLVNKKVFVVLDAVDKCDKGMVNFILWCYRFLSNNVRIIFSSRDSEELIKADKSLDTREIKYDKTDLGYIAEGMLSQHGKSINKNLIKMLCNKAESPLHLKIMLTRLLNLSSDDFSAIHSLGGGMEAINEHLVSIIEKMPEDTSHSVADYLFSLPNDKRDKGFFSFLLIFIIFNPYGLHQDDLKGIYTLTGNAWIEMDYIDFLSKYSLFIRTRDNGRIDISHDIIRYTLRAIFSEQAHKVCYIMADYFLNKPKLDAYSIRSFFETAHIGGSHRKLLDFAIKYYKTFSSFDTADRLINDEIVKCLTRDFLSDNGEFLLGASQFTEKPDELFIFHSVLSNSLLSTNDYLNEQEVFSIINGCVSIPFSCDLFPLELMYMDIDSLKRFAEHHNVKNNEIKVLFEQYEKLIKEREGKDNFSLTETVNSDDIREMIDFLNDSANDIPDKTVVLYKLSHKIEILSKEVKTANKAIDICFKLIHILDTLDFDDQFRMTLLASIYSYLSKAYKILEQWEDALKYGTMCLELNEKQYNLTPSENVSRKILECVLDLAILAEQRAIVKGNDKALWEQAKSFYEKFYTLNLQAFAQDIPEKELIQCTLSIFSYGTVLIRCGELNKGIEKYREAIKIITGLSDSDSRPDLLNNLIHHILDGVYTLIIAEKYDVATDYCNELKSNISNLIKTQNSEYLDKLLNASAKFLSQLTSLTKQFLDSKNYDAALYISKILYNVYIMLLPIAPMGLKARLITVGKDIGDLYYNKNDYDSTAQHYIALLNLISKEKLCIVDDNGRYFDSVNLLLIDIFIYIILCLDKLKKYEEANALIRKLPAWAEYIAEHSEAAKGDAPRVLYTIAYELTKDGCGAAYSVMTLAYYATKKEGYNTAAHADTIQLIINALFGPKNSKSEEN